MGRDHQVDGHVARLTQCPGLGPGVKPAERRTLPISGASARSFVLIAMSASVVISGTFRSVSPVWW